MPLGQVQAKSDRSAITVCQKGLDFVNGRAIERLQTLIIEEMKWRSNVPFL